MYAKPAFCAHNFSLKAGFLQASSGHILTRSNTKTKTVVGLAATLDQMAFSPFATDRPAIDTYWKLIELRKTIPGLPTRKSTQAEPISLVMLMRSASATSLESGLL